MGNGNGDDFANGNKWMLRWLMGGGSLVAVVLGFSLTTAKDAQIAIQVAAQHGEEMLLLRQEINILQSEIRDRTQMRYTSKDAERDLGYIKRDVARCEALMNQHEVEHHLREDQ
jgi:hypothetical protein